MATNGSLLLSLRNVYETLAISAPTVVEAFRGTLSAEGCDARLAGWAQRVVGNLDMKVEVHGREHAKLDRTYVLMSNHQSHYDVPVVYYVLGGRIRMVAKKELFDLPLFGHALRDAGFVPVDRRNRTSAIASLATAREHLDHGTHIWIAPEGTRSRTGELLPFKKGGFVLATDARAPILPITIEGTRDALLARGKRSYPHANVRVTIHPPIETGAYRDERGAVSKEARERLIADVRTAIASALSPSSQP